MITKFTQEQIDKAKEEITSMSHYNMCKIWRFENSNSIYFSNLEVSEIFKEKLFKTFGGFTPEISKSIGW